MNKLLFTLILFIFLTTPTLGLEIISPTANTTLNTNNVSLTYTTNAESVEMIINSDDPKIITENQTIKLENGDYHLTLTANETRNDTNNETISENVTAEVFFTVYVFEVDYCEVGLDILSTHNCTDDINMTIVRHECIPTKCEEMLAECQAEILPGIQNDYRNLKSQCVISKAEIETCKSEPWKWVVTVVVLGSFGLISLGLWWKDNSL